MKIFITGATGFIGNNLLELFRSTEHQLFCLVRKTNPNIKKLSALGVKVFEGDVRDKASVMKGMIGCDWVINLANVYSFWEKDKSVFRTTNVQGTRHVMECALETRVSKVVHVSSVVIFGKPDDIPFNENSQPGPVKFSEYARTKFKGDQIAWELYAKKDLPLVVVYPGAVLGPGDPKASGAYVQGLVEKTLPARVFADTVLTWVHVKDVAEGIVKALEKPNNIGEKYILGNHRLSFREFNKMISEISGVALPLIKMPDFLSLSNAYLFTSISDVIKKPPIWGMSIDQMKTMQVGFSADGSKAERDLGIKYTPIRTALKEQISALKN